jgi:hypothetical protein
MRTSLSILLLLALTVISVSAQSHVTQTEAVALMNGSGGSAPNGTANETDMLNMLTSAAGWGGPDNPQTGTTYTMLEEDAGRLLTLSNASAIAVTLPQAGTTGFEDGSWFLLKNIGAATVTVTPTTSTVDGGATLVLLSGQWASIHSDGTNYRSLKVLEEVPTVDFVNDGPTPDYLEGRLFYDVDSKALAYYNDDSNVTLQIGQELWVYSKNETGDTLDDGETVYIDGAVGASGVPTVDLALADAEATVKQVGVVTSDILNGAFGYVTVTGIVRGINTDGLGEGSLLYVSATEAGALTNIAPVSPNWRAPVAYVINDHDQNGSIFVFRETAHLGAGISSQYFRGDETWQTLDGDAVANTPSGNIAASDVQTALDELDTEKAIQEVLAGLTNALSVQQVDPTLLVNGGVIYMEV